MGPWEGLVEVLAPLCGLGCSICACGSLFFLFLLKSIRLISIRLCGGLDPLTETSLGAVDPRKNELHTNCVRPELAVQETKKPVGVIKT